MKIESKAIEYNNTKPLTCLQKLLNQTPHYTELLDRTIISNLPDPLLPTNLISTCKYNYFTFFPVNLAEQFTKLSNVYFLFIGILQMIPEISISEGKPTIFLPLLIVLVISMIKDFVEDHKRRRNDQKQNQSQVEFLSNVGFVTRKWQDLRVGDIIRIKKDQYFPCDILLLSHDVQFKTAFVETKNLDGQTNLKLKNVAESLKQIGSMTDLQLYGLRMQVCFEKPNPFLSTFNGNVKMQEKKYMVQNCNVVLRGCSLKINEMAVGMCVYTGHETKILLNSGKKPRKSSTLEKYLNTYFKYILIFQLSVTLLSAIIYGILLAANFENLGYTSESANIIKNIVFTWGSWFISFSNFIPISLLVTVEMVRFGQGILLSKDENCKSKQVFTEVQTSSINEELGQIQYVLSDKTGTLTQNIMEFKCFYVHGESYGQTNQPPERSSRMTIDLTDRSIQSEYESEKPSNNFQNSNQPENTETEGKVANVDFKLSQKNRIIQGLLGKDHVLAVKLRNALIHLSLCHNVITEKNSYTSSSPDELALVSFAKFIGYAFLRKNDQNQLQIEECLPGRPAKIIKFALLHILEFSSERKRMSVVLKEMQVEHENKIVVLTKGADEVVLQRLAEVKNEKFLTDIQLNLYNYACQGLRTLVLAQKHISCQAFQEWDQRYDQALTLVSADRLEKIYDLQSELEKELDFIGATAIEDKLQDQVKETIEGLKQANLKVWMLTGDKKETAVSIGFSCGLIDKNSQRITLDCEPQHAKNLIKNLMSMMHLISNHKKITIVSGEFIKRIDDETKSYLESILKQSQSVICCRVSPKDKEEITKMVQKWGVTLAIGDGANDVNMINSAHVGVGVRGIEGSQATRAADYVISEFKLLRRLITFYGINFYHKNSNVMLYTLYKNILATLPNLIYGTLSMESGTYIYDIWVFQFINILYLSLPIVYYGLFDQIYSARVMKQRPLTYTEGQTSLYFNRKILLKQLILSLIFAVLLVFVVFYSTGYTVTANGWMIYEEWSGMTILAIVVISCNIRIYIISHQFNIVQGFLCCLGVLLYYASYIALSTIIYSDTKNTMAQQMSSPIYWLLIFLFSFFFEGLEFFIVTITTMNRVIAKEQQKGEKADLREIELESTMHHEDEIEDRNIIDDKKDIGGYAFAEDENRPNFTAQFRQKGMLSEIMI